MPKRTHTHQYKRIKFKKSGTKVYRCMLTNCNHYIATELILGKESLCPSCDKEFIIDKYASERTFPVCQDCRRKKTPLSPNTSQPLTEVSPPSDNLVASILKKYLE